MAKKRIKSIVISDRLLGSLILFGLIIQFVLPKVGLNISWISTLIYVIVGFYLFLN